jgi:hypothetical protein
MRRLATTAALAAVVLSSLALTAAPAAAYGYYGQRVTRCEGYRCACFHCDGYGCRRIGPWYARGGYPRVSYGYGYGPVYRCDPVSNQCAAFRGGVRVSPWRPR